MSEKWKPRDLLSRKKNTITGKKTDYTKYKFSKGEYLRYFTEGSVVVGILTYFFYRNVVIFFFLSPGIFFYMRYKKQALCRQRKGRLNLQFKDALHAVNGSLQAGYSLENAFCDAYKDMVEYHGADSMIAKELAVIRIGIRNNRIIEDLIEDLAQRSGLEDIYDFAGVLRVGKGSGGNLNTIFENSIAVIEEKVMVRQEIDTLISGKKFESSIMCIIPFVIMFYVDITSKGYFDTMYSEVGGRCIMTVCFIVYLAAYRMSQKIVEIEV